MLLYSLEKKEGDIPLGVNCITVPQLRNIIRESERNSFNPSMGPLPIPHSNSVQPFSELRYRFEMFTDPFPVDNQLIKVSNIYLCILNEYFYKYIIQIYKLCFFENNTTYFFQGNY